MDHNKSGCQSAPESPMPCVKNCGFFGNAATKNMCSKCHQAESSSITSIGNCWVDPSLSETIILEGVCAFRMANYSDMNKTSEEEEEEEEKAVEGPKRCSTCRRRLGLSGFKCRCGNFFCGVHRYTDKHECLYDYRNAARDSISKANPVVKAEKLNKI